MKKSKSLWRSPAAFIPCPCCQAQTEVIETRQIANGTVTRRYRRCLFCQYRFPTFETICSEIPKSSVDRESEIHRWMAAKTIEEKAIAS